VLIWLSITGSILLTTWFPVQALLAAHTGAVYLKLGLQTWKKLLIQALTWGRMAHAGSNRCMLPRQESILDRMVGR